MTTEGVAKVVTEVAAPWVVLMAGSAVLGMRVGAPWWGLATGLGMGGIPQAGIALRVQRRRLSDHHVTRREERPLVIAGIATSVVALMTTQRCGDCPGELRRLTNAAMAALLTAGGITAGVTKVSFHTAVLAGMTAVFTVEDDPRWWWASLGVPVVGWSRVKIDHHSVPQTVLGAVLGMTAGVAARGR